MEDEKHLITTIFWWVLAFALSVLMISVGAAWSYLSWIGFLPSGQLWLALLVCGLAIAGAVLSFVGIARWFLHQAPA